MLKWEKPFIYTNNLNENKSRSYFSINFPQSENKLRAGQMTRKNEKFSVSNHSFTELNQDKKWTHFRRTLGRISLRWIFFYKEFKQISTISSQKKWDFKGRRKKKLKFNKKSLSMSFVSVQLIFAKESSN